MFNLLKVEFYKLKTSKMFYFTMLLNLLQTALIYVFSENIKLYSGEKSLIFIFNMQSALFLDILIGLFASDFIVMEFNSGYVKNLISYGHKRIRIFTSKTIVYYVSIAIIIFTAPLIVTITNTVKNGYGETFTFNSLLFIIKTLLIILLIYIAIGSISVLAAFVFRSSNVTICIIAALDFISRIFDAESIRNSSLLWIYSNNIFSQPGIVLSDKVTNMEVVKAVIISFLVIFLTTSLGIYEFKKADVK